MANSRNGSSPSVNINIQDLSFVNENPGLNLTTLGVAGETLKGRAFDPIFVDSYDTYQQLFGGLNPCKFEGTQQPIYETSYIAKQFLEESNSLYVTRVLGLSGYDAGDAWSITVGGAPDLSTVQTTTTGAFSAIVEYVNGTVNTVVFSDPLLQTLYNEGEIQDSVFGLSTDPTGSTISQGDVYYTDCNGGFRGARFNATLTDSQETSVCITGSTITSSFSSITEVEQTCTVVYSPGTITENSTLIINVVSAIVLVNNDTNTFNQIRNGLVQINGGTITHTADGGITIENGTIFLPDGITIQGGNYKICDLEGNDAVYDCTTVNGQNYVITTGTTTTTIPVIQTGTTAFTADIPSGIVTNTFSGTFTQSTGNTMEEIDGTIALTLRSYASYDGNESLGFNANGNILQIAPVSGSKISPFDDFKLMGILNDGTTFEYIVSMDRSKKNYIGRVFGGSFIQCCPSSTPFYIEENYITMFEQMVADGRIDCIKPTICYNDDIGDYKTEYRSAITPWVVSEVRGNRVFRLFRFHTFSDGNAANSDIKVSIENIRPDRRDFDVVIRSFADNDKRPVVLERYSRVNLSTTSNNYIGLAMGTADGQYQLQSRYAILEINGDCLDDSFPAGFEGYPVRDYGDCKAPRMTYKTSYLPNDRIRNVYLGISDTIGIEQDLFDYKGIPSNPMLTEYTGLTAGFHMDIDAATSYVDGADNVTFEAGAHSFKNEAELQGTSYENLNARKFTLLAYGGFDGWDIHRKTRTNTDMFAASANKGMLGKTVGNFEDYVLEDGTVGITSDFYAYMMAIKTFDNPENVIIDLLATPNVNTLENSDLVEETIEMIEEDRCDAFYVPTTIDHNASGIALGAQDLGDNIDDLFDTPYAATYAYWGQYNDTENNTRLYIPPTAEVMKTFALTDKVSAPWYSNGGTTRGLTEFINLRKKPKMSERDTLYDFRVNSLYYDRGQSYIWGNRTLQIAESSLTQISIVRLALYLRRQISRVGLNLLFQPNDDTLKEQFRRQIEPILADVRRRRGIFSYSINLTSSGDELNGSISIEPTPALEEINLALRITATGSQVDIG